MPRYICKLEHEGQPIYFEWSTIVDAPVTYGMTLEQFTEYYQEQYGRQGMFDFEERMKRVEAKGTSAHNYRDVEEVIAANRAGPDEKALSKEELVKSLMDYPKEE